MAVLSFKVQADYEKVVKLREEIAKLETQLRSVGKNTPEAEIHSLEGKLAEAKGQFTELATEAAKAGNAMESKLKKDIRSASKEVDNFTSKIIEQKAVVKDVEFDVKKLGEAYRKAMAGKNSGKAVELKQELDAAKKALDEEKAALFSLTQEQAKARLSVKQLKESYEELKEEAGDTAKETNGLNLSLGKIAALVGGVSALKQLAAQVVRIRGEFQDMETAISTLVGQEMADTLMPKIKEMAKISPLTMTDIVGAEKMMLGFNIEAEKTIDYLRAISDVSMGSSQKFNSLTLAFSQMSAAGRLMGQDLNQMINAGFNPLQIISEKTGKSIAQLKEEMSKGAVSAEMVQQAFLDATAAGGKFYNMSENASKTINGQISMMQDAMDAMYNEIGTKTEGIIIKSIQMATSMIQNYEKIGKVLAGLVATYGVYRTAVLLSTAATSKHTIAEIALTNVRIAATKAQKLLNAAMLTNPYVAVATAVAGLAATMWVLHDKTTAAEKAQEDYNKRKEEAEKQEKEHKNAIEGLINTANDETVATRKRQEALQALKSQYKDIFGDYDLEALKLANTRDLLQQVNAEYDRKQQKAREDEYQEKTDFINTYAGRDGGAALEKKVDEAMAYRQQMRDEATKERVAEYISILEKQSDEYLEKVLAVANAANEGKGGFQLNGLTVTNDTRVDLTQLKKLNIEGENLKEVIAAINKEVKKRADAPTFAVDYQKAKEEWEAAKKELDKIEKDKDKFTTKQYEDAKARKETAEKNFKKLGGDPKEKTETNAVKKHNEKLAQQEKLQQNQSRTAKERARTATDMEFMVEQARIDAMKEGNAKMRAQRDLDNKKALEQLERQKQDYIDKAVEQEKAVFDAQEDQRAKNDAKYKKQTFDSAAARKRIISTDPNVARYGKVAEYTAQTQNANATKQDTDAWRNSMNAYLREYGSYEGKKLAITQEYEKKIAEASDVWEKGALTQKMKEELAALDIEANKTTNAIAQLFGDMRDKSVSQLEDISARGTEALTFLKEGKWDEDKGETLGITKETFEVWSKSPEKLKAIADALRDVEQTAEKLRNPLDKIVDGFKDMFNAAGDKNKFNAAFAQISQGVSEITDAIGFVSDSLASMGEALGSEGLTKASEGINSALNVVGQTMAGAEAFKAFGPWGQALGAVVGLASSLVTEISKAKDAVHDAEIERLAKETEALDKSYDSLSKSIEKAFSADASNLISQQNTLLEQKKANLKLMIEEEQAKKNVDQGQVDEWLARIEEIDDAIEANENSAVEAVAGQSVMSAIDSFANAYADAWANGADAAEASTKAVRNMLRGSLIEFLKGQLSDEVEAFNNRLAEAMKDGIVEPWEESQLDALREKMDGEAQKYYEQTSKYWRDEDTEVTQQEASRRGYETLSEDTGNELVGRALAQYESNLRMEDAMRSTKDSVDLMAANQVQMRDIAAESRTLIADSYLELQQIRENTGAIIKPIKELNDRTREWDSKIRSL